MVALITDARELPERKPEWLQIDKDTDRGKLKIKALCKSLFKALHMSSVAATGSPKCRRPEYQESNKIEDHQSSVTCESHQ